MAGKEKEEVRRGSVDDGLGEVKQRDCRDGKGAHGAMMAAVTSVQ